MKPRKLIKILCVLMLLFSYITSYTVLPEERNPTVTKVISCVYKKTNSIEETSEDYASFDKIMGTTLLPQPTEQYIVPSWVKKGDILFIDCRNDNTKNEWARPGKCNDHVTIYIGKGYVDKSRWPWEFIANETGEDWFVEALGCNKGGVPNGVQMNNYSFYFRWGKNFRFGCVVNQWLCRIPDEKIDNAISFAMDTFNRSMIKYHKYDNVTKKWSGGNYQVFFEFPYFGIKHFNPNATLGVGPLKKFVHPTADKWYCAEFAWAAYKNCDNPVNHTGKGIDIDANEWRNFDIRENWLLQVWYGFLRWMTPQEILWDNNIFLSPILYQLSITVDGDGIVIKNPSQCTYTHGEMVELTAVPDPGWTFNYWSGDIDAIENPVAFSMADHDMQVTAHFNKNFEEGTQ